MEVFALPSVAHQIFTNRFKMLKNHTVHVKNLNRISSQQSNLQGDFESCADIPITSHWPHVEPEKNI
jgi:hypothetical protein